MGQVDTTEIQHDLSWQPNYFRDANLEQIINDISEEDTGKGYSEITYSGVFVIAVTVWTDAGKSLKRSHTAITRTGAFVTGIVKTIYDEDTGLVIVSTITTTITYDAQHKLTTSTVTTARL